MDTLEVKRLDHLGIVAGVIKELGLVKALDERLQKEEGDQEWISPGEAIAGMIINGLGFSDRPLTLTPQFFESKALEQLFRPGIKADYFNRHKLGKTLDFIHAYGCEKLFYELSVKCCRQENISLRFNSEDTTSLSVSGDYSSEPKEHTVTIRKGYSKDQRSDLNQVIHELLVSQDGGVPLMMKSWDGNASDNIIFESRCNALIEHFKQSDRPRYLIADSKLYHKKNMVNLAHLPYITRIPGTLKSESEVINRALKASSWKKFDNNYRYQEFSITHYDLPQRWIVVFSDQAKSRAEKTIVKACKKEQLKLEKALWHLSNQPYGCKKDAKKALDQIIQKSRYHHLASIRLSEKKKFEKTGRPRKGSHPKVSQYFIHAKLVLKPEALNNRLNQKACFVLGTTIPADELSPDEIIAAYKQQHASIENTGFRFLKDPLFFTRSFCLKKPSRIMGLLTIMTLALLVYSIAQRRLRAALEKKKETLPNQINQPISRPTLRWIFQLLDGIHIVKITRHQSTDYIIEGMTEIKERIIAYFGDFVRTIYKIDKTIFLAKGGSSM